MKALAIAATLLLSASPFPEPKQISVTDRTRCDWGPVASVDVSGSKLILTTPAGPLTLLVDLKAPVYGADGKPTGLTVGSLHPGQHIRVYYVVENGAKVLEVDIE
jgi:hypothetical protein